MELRSLSRRLIEEIEKECQDEFVKKFVLDILFYEIEIFDSKNKKFRNEYNKLIDKYSGDVK